MITPKLIETIKKQFRINWNGIHGIRHWARVYDIGMKLCKQTGANRNVVKAFSIFHDSQRHNENIDPDHGPRGAELAVRLRQSLQLTDEEFNLLHMACSLHTSAESHEDITLQTCFDSDRLDLGRVGIVPDPHLLCTGSAQSAKMIAWAYRRSQEGFVPDNPLGLSIL